MQSLLNILNGSGLNCSLEQNEVIKIQHFPRENIYIERHNGIYKIKNGIVRHIFLAILLGFLLIFMEGNIIGQIIIALLAIYSTVQAIRITIITSSLHVILSTFQVSAAEVNSSDESEI
ncbi:hypothetical protein [Thalassotalea litorea]|uniref:hypothetical protein n=1 Tax=Thalassotalea litorea TaxID=2020715 RepID=UPI001BB15518|nr:hypothetical protein [Thalassotalea litorea]